MQRRSKVIAVSLLSATTVFVIAGLTLPDPPGESSTSTSTPSPAKTVYVDRPVPGPTKTVTVEVQHPADAACLKAGELAEKLNAASVKYSAQFAPVSQSLNKAIKAAYAGDQGDMNEAVEELREAQSGTDESAQTFAFTAVELNKAVKECKAAK